MNKIIYVCPRCKTEYTTIKEMKVSSIPTNGPDWEDIYYDCQCGELLGCNGIWYYPHKNKTVKEKVNNG